MNREANNERGRMALRERSDERDDGGSDGMSLAGFLGHKTSGGSGEYLRAWRKEGEIKIWLHTKAGFHALWNHNWPRVVAVKDKQNGGEKMMVFSQRFVCHDPETITRKARFKEDDGRREHPPLLCPMCLMLDWISGEIAAGRLDWTKPLFRFEGDDDEHTQVLHAGGMVGLYKSDLSKEEQQKLKKAGISLKTAWKEKVEVRCQYLFQVVDDSDPSAGVVKALEAGDLGDKLKDALRKEIKKRGERGNPAINPYPLLWSYDENEPQFGKKYDVTALDEERPTKEILRHITGPRLDLTKDTSPGDCVELRTALETHALVDMPWDEFFAPAEKEGLMRSKAGATSAKKTKPAAAPATSIRSAPAGRDDDEEDDEEELDEDDAPCDVCKKPLGPDDLICGACGTTYDDNGTNIVIDGIPCRDCKTVVLLKDSDADDKPGTLHICGACATVHRFTRIERSGDSDLVRWEVEKRHPKAEEKTEGKPAPKGGRRRAASAKTDDKPAEPTKTDAERALDEATDGENLNF
jgi:hypothetical protein